MAYGRNFHQHDNPRAGAAFLTASTKDTAAAGAARHVNEQGVER